jgi:hypothetical protein
MTSLAQQMANVAVEAQRSQEDLKLEQERIYAQKERERGAESAEKSFSGYLENIKLLAEQGKRQIKLGVQSWSRTPDLTLYQQAYAEKLSELMIAEGFKVTTYSDCDEPVGSDPVCWHTVYHYGLIVSW